MSCGALIARHLRNRSAAVDLLPRTRILLTASFLLSAVANRTDTQIKYMKQM